MHEFDVKIEVQANHPGVNTVDLQNVVLIINLMFRRDVIWRNIVDEGHIDLPAVSDLD